MRKKDNFTAVDEMRRLLSETKKLTLENYILPEEEGSFEEEMPMEHEEEVAPQRGIGDIEKELIEIRKIALSVINRLADQTSSESYDTMKRIWSLVDKAIESKNSEDGIKNNQRSM